MKTVKQVAADEVRFMWGPLLLGFMVTALAYVMILRGDTHTAYGLMGCTLVWHMLELIVLLSFRSDIRRWAIIYRGRY